MVVWNTGLAAERARHNLRLKNKRRPAAKASSSKLQAPSLTGPEGYYRIQLERNNMQKKKFKIQMDFEGMEYELQPYDGLIIEAEDEDQAEKVLLKKIKDDYVSPLPYFGISEEN